VADSQGSVSPQDLLDVITLRASKDEEFRSALLADPNGAVERAMETKLPPGVEIQARAENGDVQVAISSGGKGELSDEQLAGVSGGQTQGEIDVINWLNSEFDVVQMWHNSFG